MNDEWWAALSRGLQARKLALVVPLKGKQPYLVHTFHHIRSGAAEKKKATDDLRRVESGGAG